MAAASTFATLVAAGALLAQPAAALSVVAAEAAIKAFGEACLARTPATPESLAALAARSGWPAVSVERPRDLEWRTVYRAGDAVVRLDQHRATDLNPGERICIVLVGPAPAGWRERVSALSANGAPVGAPGAYDPAVYQLPPGLELTVWDLPDGSRIHALREPDGLLELSVNYPTE